MTDSTQQRRPLTHFLVFLRVCFSLSLVAEVIIRIQNGSTPAFYNGFNAFVISCVLLLLTLVACFRSGWRSRVILSATTIPQVFPIFLLILIILTGIGKDPALDQITLLGWGIATLSGLLLTYVPLTLWIHKNAYEAELRIAAIIQNKPH